ncbi:uncharacterized protein LOC121074613 [Cygnus olor]|uniref:uncharacterized protein LOC121074613 n=1 Tax=Cygnus olor TaxID=8869 RepID=UPI001ADE32F6|nr:uncharacterized protein LOC121074613 [Cygnus olor]
MLRSQQGSIISYWAEVLTTSGTVRQQIRNQRQQAINDEQRVQTVQVMSSPSPPMHAEQLTQEMTHRPEQNKASWRGQEPTPHTHTEAPQTWCWLPSAAPHPQGDDRDQKHAWGEHGAPQADAKASPLYIPGGQEVRAPLGGHSGSPTYPRVSGGTRKPCSRQLTLRRIFKKLDSNASKPRIQTQNGAARPDRSWLLTLTPSEPLSAPGPCRAPQGAPVKAAAGAPLSAPTPR